MIDVFSCLALTLQVLWSEMATVHIPAWKRLGLQLKNQSQALISEEPIIQPANVQNKKRKLGQDGADVNKSKKQKSQNEVQKEHEIVPTPSAAPPQNGIDPATTEASVTIAEPQTLKPKKPKKIKAKPAVNTEISTSHTPVQPFLQYLNTYANNQPNWKFNKAHQTHLLKNIFNIYRIPTTYDTALASYIKGLQGSAARARLLETARGILDERAGMEDAQRQAEAREAARQKDRSIITDTVEQALSRAAEDETKAKKRKRAEEMILALNAGDGTSDRPFVTSTTATTPSQPVKRARTRKLRTLTGLPDDDDTSSSENSSESSSESSDDSSSESSGESSSDSSSASGQNSSSGDGSSDGEAGGNGDDDSDGDSESTSSSDAADSDSTSDSSAS